jgi:hypothetical protein
MSAWSPLLMPDNQVRKPLERVEYDDNELPRRKRRGISKGFIPSYRSKLRGI